MKRSLWLFVLWSLLSLQSVAADPSLLPTRVQEAISSRVAAGDYPAMVVVVVDGDRSDVYGFGIRENGKAPDADTIFQIGSITKTFTATLLAEAVIQGAVTLDTPVSALLPADTLPTRGNKQITLGDLASQFSGLPRLPNNLNVATAPDDPYANYDATKLKAFLAGYELPRDPGSAYEYSNLGYGLLGYALAQHAATSYAALLRTTLFKPLGMSSSSATFHEPMDNRWATGHDTTGKATKPWHFDVLGGAGTINSTGADMLRYLEANMGRSADSLQPAVRLAQKPRREVGSNARIGLAWMTQHSDEADVIWHNGMTAGYASFIGFTANRQRGVVILANKAQSVDDLGFAALLSDAPLAVVEKTIALSSEQLDIYTGEYQLAENFTLRIFNTDDQLYAQATGQDAFPIFPSAENAFFAKVADIRIDFQLGKDGQTESLELHQGGHTSAARKLDKNAIKSSAGLKAIIIDTATLEHYVGRYQLAPNVIFDISLDKGQLMAQLSGQPSFPIYPSAEDEFFYTVVDAQLSFKRDLKGAVNALVLHQNGADQVAKRIGR